MMMEYRHWERLEVDENQCRNQSLLIAQSQLIERDLLKLDAPLN